MSFSVEEMEFFKEYMLTATNIIGDIAQASNEPEIKNMAQEGLEKLVRIMIKLNKIVEDLE